MLFIEKVTLSLLISLIHVLYNPELVLPHESGFYERSLEEIEHFSLSPQIYHLLKQRELLHKTPPFFQERLRQESNKALYQNILIRNQTMMILKQFEEYGIRVIPLKGVLFAEKYFGHIGARWTSDIDLLIHRSDLKKAAECVKSLGFAVEEEPLPAHFHCSFSKQLPHSSIPLMVEIHWDLLKENTSNLKIEAFWKQARPYRDFQFVQELSDYHTFYMICLHGWKHYLNSLKYFIDIMQMIYRLNKQLDYSVLWQNAEVDKTLRRMKRTLKIVYDQFPQLDIIKALPIQRRKDFWWEYQAIRDGKQQKSKQYLNILQFEFGDFDSFRHCLWAISHWKSLISLLISQDGLYKTTMDLSRRVFLYLKMFLNRH
jgi:hypothetical protein